MCVQTNAKCKSRQCVHDAQNHYYNKIYCKAWERERREGYGVGNFHQKCVGTTVKSGQKKNGCVSLSQFTNCVG